MCRFIGFKNDGTKTVAQFTFDGRLWSLNKNQTIKLHEKHKKLANYSGTNPNAEQTKFVLDRWPDTPLGKRIAQQQHK